MKIIKNTQFNKLLDFPADAHSCILTGINGSGKTRALEYITQSIIENKSENFNRWERVICLSGTVQDRFPDMKRVSNPEKYFYFGKRVNSNIFSEIGPFRTLTEHILKDVLNSTERGEIAKQYLESIGLTGGIELKFRIARGAKEKVSKAIKDDRSFSFALGADVDIENANIALKAMQNSELSLNDFRFKKSGKHLDLANLSSGERAYSLAILVSAFMAFDNSIIVFDEPENSLHPKWQSKIVEDLIEITNKVSKKSLILFATHSPLVVAGPSTKFAYVADLGRNIAIDEIQQWTLSEMYGKTSDSILTSQFDMISPRSQVFITTLQKCLTAAIGSNSDKNHFIQSMQELDALDVKIDKDDALYDAIIGLNELRSSI